MRSRAVELAKVPFRSLRDGMTRLMHPWRRGRARRQLESLGPARVIIFVCLGNICRSPYAAERFRQLAGERALHGLDIRSMGFIGPGRISPHAAQAIALERGVDLSDHRSRLLDATDVSEADLLIVMTPAQQRRLAREFKRSPVEIAVLGDLDPKITAQRAIPDPWGQPREVFHSVFLRIDRCLEAMLGAMVPESVTFKSVRRP